ncbi:hypothetical protein WJX84_005658 [Apatococcus fuscideae]|uniref:RRM domain-containing protein n=1 Tax=Apatococcus fuscideae TaxID=2026836 RepID=A0AAW1T3R3_9CHLO
MEATDYAAGEASAAQDTAADGAAEAAPGGQADADPEPEDPMELPPHGCEVFVGGVPRTATEDMLKEFAERAGPIFSCSLLKDPGNPGTNRGYGFIKYKEKVVADKAMETLHQQSLLQFPENKLRVSSSQSKNKIYVGNIPRAFSQEQIESAIKPHVVGLTATEVLQSKDFPGQNRGFCFLEFYNHACAQKAKTTLDTGSFKMGDRVLTISYAEPRRDDTQPQQKEVKACYVGHLPDNVDDTKLIEAFAPIGEVIKVVLPGGKDGRKYRDYGFVHFNERSQALKAVEDYGAGQDGQAQIQQDKAGFGDMGRGGGFGGQGARGRGGRGYGARSDYGGGYGGGYDSYGGMGGYDDGSGYGAAGGADYSGYAGYGGYGGYASAGYGAQAPVGMVPMMLPNGQVGYVLSGGAGAGGMAAGSGYGAGAAAGGPVRSTSGGGRRGGGGSYGAGGQRYRPY